MQTQTLGLVNFNFWVHQKQLELLCVTEMLFVLRRWDRMGLQVPVAPMRGACVIFRLERGGGGGEENSVRGHLRFPASSSERPVCIRADLDAFYMLLTHTRLSEHVRESACAYGYRAGCSVL